MVLLTQPSFGNNTLVFNFTYMHGQSRDPFVILEYGSNLGSISVPIASTFQRATLISVESGDIEPAQRRSMPYEAKVGH